MTADVEMLPELVDEGLYYFDKSGDEGDKLYVRAIRQHIAAKNAEVEALRAEVRDLRKRQAGWERHVAAAGCEYVRDGEHDALVNRRAERLAEALRLIAAPKRQDGTWNRDREACRQIAAEALRDHGQEVGNG